MSEFWDKVMKCEHKRLSPNYLESYGCGTPYCSAWETHCLDCGVYITECGCGSWNGLSGWPERRHRSVRHRRERRKQS